MLATRHDVRDGDTAAELIDALRSRASDPIRFIDACEIDEFRRFPRATPEQIKRAEDRVGFPLAEALRTLCLEVANGGFGPRYGIPGIDDGATTTWATTSSSVTSSSPHPDPEAPEWEWPEHAVPFCYWGCQVYSCVMPDGSVVGLDRYDWRDNGIPLVEWLSRWADGRPPQP